MIQSAHRQIYSMILLVVISLFLSAPDRAFSDSKAISTSKAVFYVYWYDVGKSALEGLKGVKEVTRGFKYFKEINTVYYDPQQITVDDMIKALKAAGTYRGVAE